MPIVGGTAIGPRLLILRRRAAAAKGLEIDQGLVATMHREQQIPFFLRPTLQQHASERVALDAGLFGVLVLFVLVVDEAAFDFEGAGLRLLGGEPVVIGEVAYDFARVRWFELDVVQRDHPLDRFLPAFRGGAPVGNARHATLVVGAVARSASLANQRAGDRDPFVFLVGLGGAGRRRGVGRGRRLLREQRDER